MLSNNYSNLLIIADDFTGANDAGVQLTKKGANVDVYFDWKTNSASYSSDIIVINTDSRALSQDDAKMRINELISLNEANRSLYKKIDSTLRGNIGAEIEALIAATDYEVAIVVSAFPDMNRTVKNGICYVNNIELMKTEFASDPKTPIYSSQVTQCIAHQTHFKCASLFLDDVRDQQLNQSIENSIIEGAKIIVIDAETNHDLTLIVEQLATINHKILLVGSAGLINFLPTQYIQPTSQSEVKQNELMLVIAGSMSKTTQLQIEYAAKHTDIWQIIDIDINAFFPQFTSEKRHSYCHQIEQALNNKKNCIVRTCKDDCERYQIDEYCQKYQLTRKQLGEYISNCLGEIVKNITIKNLFLTGGDVAIAIAKSLGATGFHIEGEVTAGVPYGKLIGNTELNYRIFTKAGGFGEQNIFTKSLELI